MDIASIEKIFEEAYEAKLKEVEAEYQYKISTLEKQLKSLSLAQSTNPFEESANIEAKKRADDLQKQLDAVIAERDTVELKRKGVWKKYDNLAAQMEGLRENHKKERDGLTAKITELARKLNDADDLDSIKAKEENLNLKQLCDIKDQEIAQWKRKTADITLIIDSGKKMYDDLNAEYQELKTKHMALNTNYETLNKSHNELINKWNKLVVSNKATCEELASLKLKVMQTPPMPPLRPPTNVYKQPQYAPPTNYQQPPVLPPMVAPTYGAAQGRMVPPLIVVPRPPKVINNDISVFVENGVTTTIDITVKNCVISGPCNIMFHNNENMFEKYVSIFNRPPKHCIRLFKFQDVKNLAFQYLDGKNWSTYRMYICKSDGSIIKRHNKCAHGEIKFEPNDDETAIMNAAFYGQKTPGYMPITDSIVVTEDSYSIDWMNL
nr:Hypothetical protein FSTVLC9_144 [Faustovirus]